MWDENNPPTALASAEEPHFYANEPQTASSEGNSQQKGRGDAA